MTPNFPQTTIHTFSLHSIGNKKKVYYQEEN